MEYEYDGRKTDLALEVWSDNVSRLHVPSSTNSLSSHWQIIEILQCDWDEAMALANRSNSIQDALEKHMGTGTYPETDTSETAVSLSCLRFCHLYLTLERRRWQREKVTFSAA